jgi:hypothetical protein
VGSAEDQGLSAPIWPLAEGEVAVIGIYRRVQKGASAWRAASNPIPRFDPGISTTAFASATMFAFTRVDDRNTFGDSHFSTDRSDFFRQWFLMSRLVFKKDGQNSDWLEII